MSDVQKRADIIWASKELISKGLNRGTSGNVSIRHGSGMLISPSAISAHELEPEMIAYMELDEQSMDWQGSKKPSSEWRFHRDILRERPDINAIVHTHAPFSTILAIAHKEIPAIHYMMAAFGGTNIKVANYATYGTAALSRNVLKALEDRNGCLMANHGMVVGGADIHRSMWLAAELEELAHQYYYADLLGAAHVLSDNDIAETLRGFSSYGVQSKES